MTTIAVKAYRQRYIAFSIESDKKIVFTRRDVIQSLQDQCLKQYQNPCKTYGFFLTRFYQNTGILRCFHTEKDRALQFLHLLKTIDNIPVTIKTIGTSGTIKSLIKKHLNGNTLQPENEKTSR